jgi:hypothetical protein
VNVWLVASSATNLFPTLRRQNSIKKKNSWNRLNATL